MQPSDTRCPTNQEWLKQFHVKAAEQRVPVSGSLELTTSCNLKCVHCYLGLQQNRNKTRNLEMSTRQVISILDEITEAGCLSLLITGGESLLRKDFPEIYRHARRKGLLVSVFTNGTVITDEILELFSDFHPRQVEISLYGATRATYEKITRVRGSYEKCLDGITRLLARHINVKLKTVLMIYNRHELSAMKEMASEYGVKFRFDPDIFPCLENEDKSALNLRVPPEEVIEIEASDEERLRHWVDYYEKRKDLPVTENLYECGAGLTSFHIDPYGNVSPCLMTPQYKYTLRNSKFINRWRDDIAAIREKKPRGGYACNSCEMRVACTGCPGFFAVENGVEDIRSEYLCAMGKLRYERIRSRELETTSSGHM